MIPSDNIDRRSSLPVIMIGAGGHARVLLDLLACLGREILFITDRDEKWHGQSIGAIEVRGSDELILQYATDQVRLVNGVGSASPPLARREVYWRFRSRGYEFDTLLHPTAIIAERTRIEAGVQIMAGAIVQTGSHIGVNSLINTRASIDHDCRIGPHVHIAPGVTLSGDVRVGEATHIGTGATVIQGVSIGAEAMIGAAAAVIRDVPDRARVVGVPARPLPPTIVRASSVATNVHREGSTGLSEPPFTVMLSAAGRRVALMKLIGQSITEAGLRPRMLVTDVNRNTAAFQLGDIARLVPRYSDPNCLEELLRLCQEFRVRLIIPTIDPDLPFYARHRDRFAEIGTHIMVSSSLAVSICANKKQTHAWLVNNGFPTVRQINVEDLLHGGQQDWVFPVFVKPCEGSSSIGARIARSLEDLPLDDEYIAQQIAPGQEYTVDVYVDRTGRCRCTVPRLRLETRGGEVNKGMTVRNEAIQAVAHRIAETLPGAAGVLNIQVFYDSDTGELNVSEINPRFGGGYPLTHEAGAPMARWAIEEVVGRPLAAMQDDWVDGLVMLRYDDAVFVNVADAGLVKPTAHVGQAVDVPNGR